jgi:thiamine-phosphate pyrophosphorylase
MAVHGGICMIKGYYFITGNDLSRRGDVYDVRQAIRCGVTVVQYRNKTTSSAVLYREALQLRSVCTKALFIINDRIDIALAVDADGVHIGQDDLSITVARKILGKKKIIGVSVSTFSQAADAANAGADYLGVGPVYATATKSDAEEPTGVALIRRIKGRFGIPVAAIGGITFDNAPSVITAGADALAAISAVVTKPDVCARIRKFQALICAAK